VSEQERVCEGVSAKVCVHVRGCENVYVCERVCKSDWESECV
jgi:hypothetical protein